MKRLAIYILLMMLALLATACADGLDIEGVPLTPATQSAEMPLEEPESTLEVELAEPTPTVAPSPTPQPSMEPATPTSPAEAEESQLSGRIAFVSNQNGPDAVYILDLADPGTVQQLTQPNSPGFDWWPTWCGSDEILFESNDGVDWKEVVAINLNDGSRETITSSTLPAGSVMNGAPFCSRDGRLLALSSRLQAPGSENLGWHTGIIDRASETFSAIGDYQYNARHLSWSPNAREAVFMHLPLPDEGRGFQIFRLALDDATAYQNLTKDSDLSGKYPNWSPVSDVIAFACSEGEADEVVWSLCTGSADEEGITVLLPEVGFGPEQESRSGDRQGYFVTPSWSPDGNYLAFAANKDGNWEIYAYELASGELLNLTNTTDIDEMQPRWGP